MGPYWNCNEKKTAKYPWKKLSQCHVVCHKCSVYGSKIGHGFGVERPAINCLGYIKAVKIIREQNKFSFNFCGLCLSNIVSCGVLSVNVPLLRT